jgi:hypothetical protein
MCIFLEPNITQIEQQSEKYGRNFRYAPKKLCLFGNNLHLALQFFSYVIS